MAWLAGLALLLSVSLTLTASHSVHRLQRVCVTVRQLPCVSLRCLHSLRYIDSFSEAEACLGQQALLDAVAPHSAYESVTQVIAEGVSETPKFDHVVGDRL